MDIELEEKILEDNNLKLIGLELMFLTPQKCSSDDGLTAIEIARKLNIPTEIVKKKLKILFDKKIVSVKGVNPKYWKFDEYIFQKMDENDPVFKLLSNFEDVDFTQYFEY